MKKRPFNHKGLILLVAITVLSLCLTKASFSESTPDYHKLYPKEVTDKIDVTLTNTERIAQALDSYQVDIDKIDQTLDTYQALTDLERPTAETTQVIAKRQQTLFYIQTAINLKDKDSPDNSWVDNALKEYDSQITNLCVPQEDRFQALKKKVWLKIDLKEYQSALDDCLKAEEQFPSYQPLEELTAEAYIQLAQGYLGHKEFDLAQTQYNHILNLKDIPSNWHAFAKDNLAHLYLLKGEDAIALGYYQSIIKDYPNLTNWSASARFSLGQYYLKHKDIEKAKGEFGKILTDYPNTDWAESAKESLKSLY